MVLLSVPKKLALAVLLFVLTPGATALACFSLPPSERREETVAIETNKADIIFRGKPIEVRRDKYALLSLWPNNLGAIVVEFEVSRVWKGKVKERYFIREFDDSCAYFSSYVWERIDDEFHEIDEYVIPDEAREEVVILAAAQSVGVGENV